MQTSTLNLILVLGLYGCIFGVIEYLQAKRPIDSELARKATHIVGGVFAAALPIAFSRPFIAAFMVGLALVMWVAGEKQLFHSIKSTHRAGRGELWFPIGIAALALLESNDLRFVCGVLVLGISDALASIIGLRLGKRKYYLINNHWKTYVGSSVFFLSTITIISLVFNSLAGISLYANVVPLIIISLVLTLLEALSHKGQDNLLLPLSTALLLGLFGFK